MKRQSDLQNIHERVFYQNSVDHICDYQALSKIDNRTYLSATANTKSSAFMACDIYTGT